MSKTRSSGGMSQLPRRDTTSAVTTPIVNTAVRVNEADRNMSEEMPIFPKARSMFIHSGNIINWNQLKKRQHQTSTEEVCECITKTLGTYLDSEDKTKLQYVTELYAVNSENMQVMDENEREEMKITVKIFICVLQPAGVIIESVNKVLNELGTSFIDTLLLSIAPRNGDNEDTDEQPISLSIIQPYWEVMEELVSAEKVISLGICDLIKEVLEDLCNWAKLKPSINQVNQELSCAVSHDFREFASSLSIQMLTHSDMSVFVPEEILQQTVRSVSTNPDGSGWAPQWVVRYSGILRDRGIIRMKGYIFHAARGNKKLPLL